MFLLKNLFKRIPRIEDRKCFKFCPKLDNLPRTPKIGAIEALWSFLTQ